MQRCCSTELAGDDSFLEFGDAIADLPPWQVNQLLCLEEKWKGQRRTVIPLRETILQPSALRRILLQRFTLLRAVVFRWHFVLCSIKRSPLWTGHDKMEYGK